MNAGVTTMAVFLGLGVGAALAASLGDLPAVKPDGNAERSQIPEVYRWDLTALVESEAAWEEQATSAAARLEGLGALHGAMGTPQGLARYLEAYFEADQLVNRITLYANLKRDTAQTDAGAIARHQRALAMTNRLMEEGPLLRQAILSFTDESLEEAIDKVPALEAYRPFIAELRRRASRVLAAEAEQVLALAGDNLWATIDLNELPSASENAFSALISDMPLPEITDSDGTTVQLTFANYGRYRGSDDREVRRRAVEAMLATVGEYQNTLAATLAGQASFDVFLARARGYDTALEAYLDKDDIDPTVYRNLIATVRDHAGALHRYVTLRQKVMGVDSVHLYDLYVPLATGVERDLPYAEGARLILDALHPLGSDYMEVLAEAIDPGNGWVDVYPSKDKASGAFSASAFGVHPYLKMNYQDRFDDVSTLAHELGHALHSHLSMQYEPYVTWRYPPFLAEIASTCNEVLLTRHMFEHATSDAERAWLLSELVESIRTTIYRQTLFAEFELELHERIEAGEPVTAEWLNSLYAGLVRDYYGPDYAMGEHDGLEWAYIPHFYWKYYVFNYATGLSSGIALAERIVTGGEPAQAAYLGMLRGGSSRPPLEMLADAGVDLTRPEAITAALELFDSTLTDLELLLVKE